MKKAALGAVAAAGILGLLPWALHAQLPQPDGGSIRTGTLPAKWDTGGPHCGELPEWQIHEYNPDLYFLRQSGCTDFEKPFVFLLFGDDRARSSAERALSVRQPGGVRQSAPKGP